MDDEEGISTGPSFTNKATIRDVPSNWVRVPSCIEETNAMLKQALDRKPK